jgi:hypothetical protein
MRRTLRRVRYGYDWVGRDGKVFAGLQELLGVVCDVGALLRTVERWSAPRTSTPAAAQLRGAALRMVAEVRVHLEVSRLPRAGDAGARSK